MIAGEERQGRVKVETDTTPGSAPVKPGYEPIETVSDDQVRQLREWHRREKARQASTRQAFAKRAQNDLYAGQVERRFVAAVVKDTTGERFAECSKLPAESFSDVDCSRAWSALLDAPNFEAGVVNAAVAKFFAHETCGEEYLSDRQAVFIGWLAQRGLDGMEEWRAALPIGTSKGKLRERVIERRFNFETPPAQPVPRFLIAGRGFSTTGNLTNVSSQAKTGKTAFISAIVAAAICAELGKTDCDTLGVTATAPGSLRLIHLDTEQSPFDADQIIRRAMRRAGVDAPPTWLESYGLAGFSAADLRATLKILMEEGTAAGGIFAVIVDGVADLANDVNDAEECNAFVADLHGLAIKHACPIIGVVHENPGQDGGKMRGHLGSQLERKAESNLRLRKAEEITVVFSDKMRGAPILERDGPRFRWSDADGMHVSCETSAKTRDDIKREKLHDQIESVFSTAGKDSLAWGEVIEGISKSEGIGKSGATKRFDAMKALGVITKGSFGAWKIAA